MSCSAHKLGSCILPQLSGKVKGAHPDSLKSPSALIPLKPKKKLEGPQETHSGGVQHTATSFTSLDYKSFDAKRILSR